MKPSQAFSSACLTPARYILIFSIFTIVIGYGNAYSQNLPPGFSQVLVANGIPSPTAMAFAPDGRIFVCQQNGQLRVIRNNALLSQPMLSLTVTSNGERGLIGIALDPDFSINNYIYLYYTLPTGSNNRISRFTASGDLIVAGSEQVLLNLDSLSTATNHNGGTMQFGKDGKLYVGIGENANPPNAQNLDTYHGKILRINPDGTVPAGNPFTSGTAQRQRIWAYGVRNPYTINVQSGTGKLFVNDVGEKAWEEINDATTGGLNFGWPNAEGTSANSSYANPLYAYAHGSGDGIGCAITGGTFFNPVSTNYPPEYLGRYFYLDFCGNWIDMLTLSGGTAVRTNFGTTNAGSRVYLGTGADGNLYFLSRTNAALYKIVYTNSLSPAITGQPSNLAVPLGNSATFNVSVSGSTPFSYQWKKNGTSISGANAAAYTINSVTAADSGTYTVVVTNAFGAATSNPATLTVLSANKKPLASINTPVAGSLYAGGSVINFSGSGTDAEDGTLGASKFKWYVEFKHDTHSHPGPSVSSGISSGAFSVPTTGETSANVFYRLFLVVTDSKGASDTAYRDILPRTSTITLKSQPSGLNLTLDGQPIKTPYAFTGVEGIKRTFGAPSLQVLNGITYAFSKWSNSSAQTQAILTPVNDSVFTAIYTAPSSITLQPLADAHVSSAANAGTNYGNSTVMYNRNNVVTTGVSFTYLKFDISSLSNLGNVKLRLFARWQTGNSSSSVQVYGVPTTSWQENAITYTNKPGIDTIKIASTVVSGTTGKYYEWDLTQHIKSLRAKGLTTASYRMKNALVTSDYILFNSRENVSNRPELKVSFSNTTAGSSVETATALMDQPAFNGIRLFPNPANNRVIISYPAVLQNSQVQLTDITGRILRASQLIGLNQQEISTHELQNGLYLVRIVKNDQVVYNLRLVIQR